ncbi:hypothetical protein ACOSQ4_016614 [Xanthoceras sorbifolium]
MISQWIKEGYSHLYLGAVRIILTLHGHKGLPVTARLALLNSIYCKYDQAVIDTSITTLHAGSICLTFYPNFNIPLTDPNICKCLKIQVQIFDISIAPGSYMATLHHQLAYRLQDHAIDFLLPGTSTKTLLITGEREEILPSHKSQDRLLEISLLSLCLLNE